MFIIFLNFRLDASQPNINIPAVEPVEQRWEESEGLYTHKKFKKMASSVVVTSVAATPSSTPTESRKTVTPPIPPISSNTVVPNTPRNIVIPPHNFPLKHSALSLIEAPSISTKFCSANVVQQPQPQQQQQHVVSSGNVHIPPPSPSSRAVVAGVPHNVPHPTVHHVPGEEQIQQQQQQQHQPKKKHVCPYCNISCTKPSVLDKHIR